MNAPRRPQEQAGAASEPLGTPLDVIERYRPVVDAELRQALSGRSEAPYGLIRYHLGWEDESGRVIEGQGGKFLRPALCLLSCEAAGGDPAAALPAAAALEFLHNFTLIHDDVEDGSRQRHGRPTLWTIWGQAQAINAGDALFALAHATMFRLRDRGHVPERVLAAIELLDETTLRLCEGQHLDLAAVDRGAATRDEYLSMIDGKSAALLAASCAIGGLLGGADNNATGALQEFGRRLGLAFQVRDDVLGIWGDDRETGKSSADDLRAGKRTLPVLLALERASADERALLERLLGSQETSAGDIERAARAIEGLGAREESDRLAQEHADAAIDALRGVSLDEQRRLELESLASFAVTRRA